DLAKADLEEVPHPADVAPGHVAHGDHRLLRLLPVAAGALARRGGIGLVAGVRGFAWAALARHRLSKPQRRGWEQDAARGNAVATPGRAARLRTDPGDELGDLLDEPRAVVAVELGPGRERARIGAVDEQLAVEVIDLVLVGPGLEPVDDLVDRVAVA